MHQPARAALCRQPAGGETHVDRWYLPMWIDHNHTMVRAILGSHFFHPTTGLFSLSVCCLRSAGSGRRAALALFWHLRACQQCVPLRPHCPWHMSPFGNRRANSPLGYTAGLGWEFPQGLVWPQLWCSDAALYYLLQKCMHVARELWANAMEFCWDAELPPANLPRYFTSACLGLQSKTTIYFPNKSSKMRTTLGWSTLACQFG